ncbi:MAG TPA: cytochrome c-type biogenesis protein [Vulgatibacter sp.]|nr:cytochrome c-type biogenesis protein [Vulgatibacter sp.]
MNPRRLLAFLPLAVLGSIAVPVIVSPAAATAIAAPAACLPSFASATSPLLAAAPADGGLEGAGTGAEAAAGDAEPTMERLIDREFVSTVVGQPAGRPLAGAELETRTHEVGLLLRCPVCQGSSVADSPSSTAINMKNEVRDLLAEGYDQGQILAWFEASYGQFVLMQPKAEGLNMLVWLGPGVVLLAGLVIVALQVRKSMRSSGLEATEEEAAPAADPELDEWLREARALAFGGDGDRPANETRHGKV